MTQNTNQGKTGTARVKRGMAEMLKGGVIMDVVNVEQAKIAEDAGAVAVMALERVPADIRAQGGVARMSDPDMIQQIQDAVSIPVMAKARIGHFVEAQVLQSLGVDYIDESEVLTPADYENHIDKWNFTVPFVCGATNLGEALRRSALLEEPLPLPRRARSHQAPLRRLRPAPLSLGHRHHQLFRKGDLQAVRYPFHRSADVHVRRGQGLGDGEVDCRKAEVDLRGHIRPKF